MDVISFEWFPKHFPNQCSFRPIGKPESTRKSLSKKDVFNEVTQMDEKSKVIFSRHAGYEFLNLTTLPQ